jgi:putative ABC transport system ATP-binding protein
MNDATSLVPVVDVDGLTKVFTGPPPVTALQPCYLQVHPGEMVAIMGPSGSGKSTLLSILGLLDTPTAGRYLLHGVDVSSLDDNERAAIRAHQLGFVFQDFQLVGHRSVADNVQLGLIYQGVAPAERADRSRETIEQVGLAHRHDAMCSRLSGGERQRVAIARALVRRPALILCDEPTGNLDTANSESVLALLDELHAQQMTIVVITHDPDVAERADRLVRIRDGHLAQSADDATARVASR